MKSLIGVVFAFVLMFVSTQDADAQIFRARYGYNNYRENCFYSYPSIEYCYPTYRVNSSEACNGGYYIRGYNGRYYIYSSPSSSSSKPVYLIPKKEGPRFQNDDRRCECWLYL